MSTFKRGGAEALELRRPPPQGSYSLRVLEGYTHHYDMLRIYSRAQEGVATEKRNFPVENHRSTWWLRFTRIRRPLAT